MGRRNFSGSAEEAWFDPAAILESDWSDEDYQSIPDGWSKSYLVDNYSC